MPKNSLLSVKVVLSNYWKKHDLPGQVLTNNLHPPLNTHHGKYMAGLVGESTDRKALWGTA